MRTGAHLTRERGSAARWIAGTVIVLIALSACGPLDQGAVMLDERSGLPALVLALCDGERVGAVRLTAAEVDGGGYTERETLWRIEAERPQAVTRFVVGEIPDGFEQVVPLAASLPERVALIAETGGGSARQHGGPVSISELRPRETAYGEVLDQLDRNADINCTSSFFGSIGLPKWLDWVALAGLTITGVVTLAERVRDRRAARHR